MSNGLARRAGWSKESLLAAALPFAVRFVPPQIAAAKPTLEPCGGWYLHRGEGGRGFRLDLRRGVWAREKRPFVMRWLGRARVWSAPNDESLRSIFMTGRFEPNSFAVLDGFLQPGMTFIDAGANIGLFSVFAGTKVGRSGAVIALEPSAREFRRLVANVKLNRLRNVSALEVGAWATKGSRELLVAVPEYAGHNTFGAFAYDIALAERQVVNVCSVDEIVAERRLSRVDCIKIDVEGAELFVLRGAERTLARWRPLVFVEMSDRTLHGHSCGSRDVWDYLAGLGYEMFWFDRETGRPAPAERRPYFDSENMIAVPSGTAPPSGGRGWPARWQGF